MATETHIPESVYLKQIGDNALSSEILEEEVIELVGNKVKHVEIISQVVETVNTQIEASIPTNESGTFFQALSVPMVTSNIPESFDAGTTKDQDPEFVKTSDSVEDHPVEITPSVEKKEKAEYLGLHDGFTTDVSVSTQTEAKGETMENDEKAIEKEECEEKDESAVGLTLSDSMAPSKLEALNTLEQNKDETCKDIQEKMHGQYTTPVADTNKQDFNEFVTEEIEDKSADGPQAIEQRESVKKIEQEEETEEIRPSVEIEEKTDIITTDACISTQTKSQVENTEHKEMDEEEATKSDDGPKEKSDIPSIKDVCEENSSEKVEYKSSKVMLNEKEILIVNKDEDEEEELNVLEKDEGEDVVTHGQDVSFEGNERGVVTGKESIEDDTEEIRSSVEATDVCISTQTKPEEKTIKDEEKNEETIESDDGQTKKAVSHMIKDICGDTISEMTESEQGLKPSESFNTSLNETEIVSKVEDQEKEQELYVLEKDQKESQVKTTKPEQVNEEVTESEDGQKENSDSLSIKVVCEETDSEKVESERVELSDSSRIKLNEKVITTLTNDEVQEKEQDQDVDDATLRDDINTDVCVSRQAELEKETIETKEKNDEKAIEKEVCEETSIEKAESEVGLHLSDSMAPNEKEDLNAVEKEDLNTVEKDRGDSDGLKNSQDTTCEDTIETTPGQYAATVADFKEQDLNEFVKEETEDKSTNVQQASEECENGENDKPEPKPEESDKHEDQENEQELNILEKDQGKDDFTSTQDVTVEGGLKEKNYQIDDIESEIVKERECIEEDTQEISSYAETPEKPEQQRLMNIIPTNVCISTKTEPDKTTETQEKNDEEAIESDDDQKKKSGIPMVEEIYEETVLEKDEKAESEEGLVSKDEDQEKVQELYVTENDQNVGNDVTSSQNASNEDVKETTIDHVTTVADLEEEAEDKAVDAQEASEPYEDRANNNREQNPEDSVKDIVHSFSNIEHKEYTEEIKQSVETNEGKDVCITTQTESQEATENEEKAIEGDDDLMEKSDNPLVKEVCEETKKTESEEAIELSDSSKMNLNEKAIEIISNDEDQEEEQETNTVVCEDELQGKSYDGELNEDETVQTGESIKGNNEDLRTSVETKEITDQGSVNAITSDVSILAQKESQEDATQNEEKNEEAIESDDGLKENQNIPSVKEVCEETSLEKVESEEGLELHDSLNRKINEKTITLKDEDQEKDQVVNMPEEGQGEDNITSSRDAISKEEEEDLQQKNCHNEINEPEFVKTRENVDEEIKSSVEQKENSEQQELSYIITNDVCSSTQAKEETIENEAKLDAENQADRTEDKSEMEDEVVSTEKMSSDEQNTEEIESCLAKTTEDEVTKKDDSSHINLQDTNDGTTKEQCFLDESRDIEIPTLEHEPIEEQNSGLNEVSKEKYTDLNETTAVEPQDTPPSSLEPSTQDTSNIEKAKAESEILPIEDLESVTEIQIPELVPNLEESKLISVTGMHLDDEEETVIDENSSEKTEQPTDIKKETFEEVSEKCENVEKNKEEEKPAESIKLEDQEKEQEVNMLEKDEGEDEITNAGVQESNHHNEGNEQEVVTIKARIVEDIEEIRSNVEAPDRAEQERLINVIPTDVCISTQTEPEEKENEKKIDEKAICEEIFSKKVESEEGSKLSDSPGVSVNGNEIKSKDEYQETGQGVCVSEKGQGGEDDFLSSKNASIEDIQESTYGQHATTLANFEEEKGESAVTEEIIMEKAQNNAIDAQEMSSELEQPKEQNVKEIRAFLTTATNKKTEDSSHDNMEDTNDNTIKEEKCTLDTEPVEEQNGRGLDEVSKENLTDLNDTTEVEPQEDIIQSGTLGTLTEDTSKSEKAKAENEVLPIEDLESVSEIQIIQVAPNSEEKETVTEEYSSDEKTEQTTEIKPETFEETSSEKAGSEGFKLSDSSCMEINEKVMTTFNDEDQETGQEVNISAEGQGKDNVIIAQDEDVEEEVLQEKNFQNKDNEHEFVETRDEDTKEIISSVETREHKSESPLLTEVCEATNSEKAELEDGVKHSESFNTKVVDDETVSKEENLEKKQELMSEVQGGGDDVISSNNVSNEDIKEATIGQCATTVVDFEEGQDQSSTTNKILVEEAAEDKSVDVHAQEASESCENETKDKSEQHPEESVDKPVKSCVEIAEEYITEDDANALNNEEFEAKLDEENQADRTEDRSEVKDEVASTEKMPSEHGQPKEQNIEEIEACLTKTITEKTEDEITKKEEDSSQENIEDPNDDTIREEKRPLEHEPTAEQHGGLDEVLKENITNLYETTAVEPQEDITPSSSLGTSTEDASAKAESENLPTEDLESVSEVQIPQVVSKSADVKDKEESLMSESATKEILSDEQTYKSYITTEENLSQLEQISGNDSSYEKRDMEEDGTQENHLNSTEECDEMVKDAILTEKVSYKDPIAVINREAAEVRVDTLMGQEDLQATEDISCESTINSESVDEAPKEEIIPSLEEVKTIEPEVNLSNVESTPYPSESEKLPAPALESVCDVQASEVSADSEDREMKEECIVLATAQHTDQNNSEEEQKKNTKEILSVPEEENVKQVPDKSNEEKTDLNSKEKSSTEESLELHGEHKATSESIIEEDKVNKIEPQPEKFDIASENIMNDQESKLEHMNEKDLEDGKKDTEKDLMTDEVSEKDNFPTELDKISTSNQKEIANEIELSEPIQVANAEVTTEAKAESKIELENLQPAEDLSCVQEASSTIIGEIKDDSVVEASKNGIIPVPEIEIESTDTPLNEQDSIKLREVIPCSSQETVDEKVVLVSQLTDREILEAPDVEFEKKERELISDVQPPEAILKTEVKEECPETTNDTCETLMGVESSEKKLVSTVPPEELTSPMVEAQTNELVSEADKTKVEQIDISNTDQNPKFMEEEFTETFPEDRTSIKERYIENEKSSSGPDELVEKKDSVEVTEDPKLMAESLNLKDESFTVMKARKEDSDVVIKTDVNEEKEAQDEPRAYDLAQTTSEEKPREVSDIVETVSEGREASAVLTENLQEASPDMSLAENDPEITTATEKIEDKKVECLPVEQTGELQVSTLNSEIVEGKQNVPGDMHNKEREAPVIDVIKHEKGLDHTTEEKSVDVASNAECLEIEAPHLDTNEATSELINQENKKEANENMDTLIPVEDVKSLIEVKRADLEVPSVMDPKDEAYGAEKGDRSKPIEEVSQEVDAPVTQDKEENEEEETGDAPVMVEASEAKVHKKSHNILSGVGSKVKHSIAKVKKVITGKSSHPKPPSP